MILFLFIHLCLSYYYDMKKLELEPFNPNNIQDMKIINEDIRILFFIYGIATAVFVIIIVFPFAYNLIEYFLTN